MKIKFIALLAIFATVSMAQVPAGTITTNGQLRLSWSYPNTNDTISHTFIQRSTNASQWVSIANLPWSAGLTNYTDAGLLPQVTYSYRVACSNSVGQSDYSNTASNRPIAPPFIVTPPQSQTVALGSTANFSVIATGAVGATIPMRYQWRVNGTPVANATNTSYSQTATTNALINVVVSNGGGTNSSDNAILIVWGAPQPPVIIKIEQP